MARWQPNLVKAKTGKKTLEMGYCVPNQQWSSQDLLLSLSPVLWYTVCQWQRSNQSPIPKGLETQKFKTETKELIAKLLQHIAIY